MLGKGMYELVNLNKASMYFEREILPL
jgi:hypothetical protein